MDSPATLRRADRQIKTAAPRSGAAGAPFASPPRSRSKPEREFDSGRLTSRQVDVNTRFAPEPTSCVTPQTPLSAVPRRRCRRFRRLRLDSARKHQHVGNLVRFDQRVPSFCPLAPVWLHVNILELSRFALLEFDPIDSNTSH